VATKKYKTGQQQTKDQTKLLTFNKRNVAHTHISALWQRLIYFSRDLINHLK
jgi:hypothetical protein